MKLQELLVDLGAHRVPRPVFEVGVRLTDPQPNAAGEPRALCVAGVLDGAQSEGVDVHFVVPFQRRSISSSVV